MNVDFDPSPLGFGLVSVLGVIAFWSMLAITVKRWHDIGVTGWFSLLSLPGITHFAGVPAAVPAARARSAATSTATTRAAALHPRLRCRRPPRPNLDSNGWTGRLDRPEHRFERGLQRRVRVIKSDRQA